eukprot:scaffold20725_cov111-Isochrysis_galbana.AAC.14
MLRRDADRSSEPFKGQAQRITLEGHANAFWRSDDNPLERDWHDVGGFRRSGAAGTVSPPPADLPVNTRML